MRKLVRLAGPASFDSRSSGRGRCGRGATGDCGGQKDAGSGTSTGSVCTRHWAERMRRGLVGWSGNTEDLMEAWNTT